jgi:hypothetical protein
LRGLRVEPEDGGFGRALELRLLRTGPPRRPGPFDLLRTAALARLAWPAAGLAAGVAAFLLLVALRGATRPAAVARLPASQVAVIHLDLTADAAVAAADIEVSLPDGLFFWAEGRELAQRSFEWTQPLGVGVNEFPIAVRGQRPGQYRVRVNARTKDEQLTHEVLIEVTRG